MMETRDWYEMDDIMLLIKHGASEKDIASALDIPLLAVLMVIGHNIQKAGK